MSAYNPVPLKKCSIDGCDNLRRKGSQYCLWCGEKRRKEKVKKTTDKYRAKAQGSLIIDDDDLPICPICRTPFHQNSGRQVFCGAECRKKARIAGLKYESAIYDSVEEIKPIPFRDVKCKCPRCKQYHWKYRLPEANGTMTWEYCDNCKEINQIASNVEPSFCSAGDIWDD